MLSRGAIPGTPAVLARGATPGTPGGIQRCGGHGASTSLPGLLQSLFGYDAYVSGLVQSPAGVFSVMMLLVVAGTVAITYP